MKAETAILQAIIASLWTRAQLLTVGVGGRWSSIYDSPLDPLLPLWLNASFSDLFLVFPFLFIWAIVRKGLRCFLPVVEGRAGHPRAAGRSTARWGTETLGKPRWIRLPALLPTDKGISVYSAKNDKYSRSKLRSTEPLSLLGSLCGICTRRHLM